jgi:hypothetical protein
MYHIMKKCHTLMYYIRKNSIRYISLKMGGRWLNPTLASLVMTFLQLNPKISRYFWTGSSLSASVAQESDADVRVPDPACWLQAQGV